MMTMTPFIIAQQLENGSTSKVQYFGIHYHLSSYTINRQICDMSAPITDYKAKPIEVRTAATTDGKAYEVEEWVLEEANHDGRALFFGQVTKFGLNCHQPFAVSCHVRKSDKLNVQ